MTKILGETSPPGISVQRSIGKIEGSTTAPVVIFFGGLHGNEPVGIYALQQVFKQLQTKVNHVNGSVYALSGNLPALLRDVRFIAEDLNRIWTPQKIQKFSAATPGELSIEEQEAREIYQIISALMEKHTGPFYFIDFHTTSSQTIPFITISDSLMNRKFSALFPVPIVLGIEEYLQGALLSYANALGYIALAFESGQHKEKNAVHNTIAFIYLTLVFSGCLQEKEIPRFQQYVNTLKTAAAEKNNIYEITGHHQIQEGEAFKMLPGFGNFESVSKGTPLAKSNKNTIKAAKNTVLFMPLYQNQGKEGFFLIRKIPRFFLKLSAWLRASGSDAILTLLPGVSWNSPDKRSLRVNLKTARFLTKPFFHLLGYRSWQIDETHVRMSNRERVAKTSIYKTTPWYRRN